MRHAILGAGGVGSFLCGCLTHAGDDVLLLVRPEAISTYPNRLAVHSATLGDFEVPISAATTLTEPVDAVWVTVKATQLESASTAVPADALGDALVIPLLNGIDHLDNLRARYSAPKVAAGTIRVEAERVAPGEVRQPSPFAAMALAADEGASDQITAVAARVEAAGLACEVSGDMVGILWRKLAFLAPLALTTTAAEDPLGAVRADPSWRSLMVACADEACWIAAADGAQVSKDSIVKLLDGAYPEMRSSMQKDVEAGRLPELDAIGGPIVRRGAKYGIATPATSKLIDLVEAKLPASRVAR